MESFQLLGRTIIVLGVVLVVLGLALTLGGRLPGIGRLPGDILIKRENFTFYFPLGTSILLSIILTFLFRLFR